MAVSLMQLRDRQRTEPDWLIPNLLKRQNTMIVMGQPKRTCKSWLMLEAAFNLAEAEPLWGIHNADGTPTFQATRQMRTVYFTQEDTEDDIQDRVLAQLSRREASDRLWIIPKDLRLVLDSPDGRRLIQGHIDEVVEKAGPIDLVVFDPMRRFHHGDENDSSTIAQMWGIIDRLHKRYNCATAFVHHTIKPPMDKTAFDPTDPYTARGSGDIYGGGDAFAVVLAGPGTDRERKVTVHFESKRSRPLPPAMLKVNFSNGKVDWLGAGHMVQGRQDSVRL